MQSEYWHIKYYSLLIMISAFLIASLWKCRKSALAAKAEVTVQLESSSEGGQRGWHRVGPRRSSTQSSAGGLIESLT